MTFYLPQSHEFSFDAEQFPIPTTANAINSWTYKMFIVNISILATKIMLYFLCQQIHNVCQSNALR